MKRHHYIILVILAVFIITNPSASAFKEYLGSTSYGGLKRTTNLFICSVYRFRQNNYFALFGNFFEVHEIEFPSWTHNKPKATRTPPKTGKPVDTLPHVSKNNPDPLHILSK